MTLCHEGQDLEIARLVAHSDNATRTELLNAAFVLASFGDAEDQRRAREIRSACWGDHASELQPEAARIAKRLAHMNRDQMRADQIGEALRGFGWVLLFMSIGVLLWMAGSVWAGLPDVLAQAEALRGGM